MASNYKNIETDYIGVPDDEIFYSINKIIKNEFPGLEEIKLPLFNFHLIGYLINYITVEKLLISTVHILKEFGMLKDYDEIIKSIDFNQPKRTFTKKELIKIFAFITSSRPLQGKFI